MIDRFTYYLFIQSSNGPISFPEHARSRVSGGPLTRERACSGNEIGNALAVK